MQIEILDVSGKSYPYRLCAAALQGLLNRSGPLLYLDYGSYDDLETRSTNEVFIDDEAWYGKYRELVGIPDRRNLDYYREAHGASLTQAASLEDLIAAHREDLQGCVVWDQSLPDTANIALMMSAQQDLLPVEAEMVGWAKELGLEIREDLRGRWRSRIELYTWAFEHLFAACKPGAVACVEPGWQRPEFADTIVQQKLFTYSLGTRSGGWADQLLLLLAFGPPVLRELLFALRLDGPIRRFALEMMGRRSPEVKLATRIQRAVKAAPYPTIFGWHTRRDDEMAFMLHLSANGLRLVPSHLGANLSFHSKVAPLGFENKQTAPDPELDPEGVYLTFTLSDGDQLMMMCTGELGNWYAAERGSLPFNWETQPLLAELAPALLEKYTRSATSNDCLVAGPSGAGYIIPPLAPDLPAYLEESRRICQRSGIDVVTFYVADPPRRLYRLLRQHSQGLTGYLAGYGVLERTPQVALGEAMFIANRWPPVPHIWDKPDEILAGLQEIIAQEKTRPAFIAVHLFAYRTSLADVCGWAEKLNDPHIHIVRADTFLRLARQNLAIRSGGKQHA